MFSSGIVDTVLLIIKNLFMMKRLQITHFPSSLGIRTSEGVGTIASAGRLPGFIGHSPSTSLDKALLNI